MMDNYVVVYNSGTNNYSMSYGNEETVAAICELGTNAVVFSYSLLLVAISGSLL